MLFWIMYPKFLVFKKQHHPWFVVAYYTKYYIHYLLWYYGPSIMYHFTLIVYNLSDTSTLNGQFSQQRRMNGKWEN
jgi:hypothetical protein